MNEAKPKLEVKREVTETFELGGVAQPLIDVLNNLGHLLESAGRFLDMKTKLLTREMDLKTKLDRGLQPEDTLTSNQPSQALKEENKRLTDVVTQQRDIIGRLNMKVKNTKSWRDDKSQPHKKTAVQNPQPQSAEPQHAKIEEKDMQNKPAVTEREKHQQFSNNALREGLERVVTNRAE